MLLQILTIARNTFVESIRQPIFFVVVMLSGILQVLNTWNTGFSMGYTDSGEVSGDNKLLLDIGMATVFICGMLLAAFVATSAVSREIERKTVLTVVSKPIARPVVILGKYAGVAGAILVATVTMLVFLLYGIRHGVMSTAADTVDGPVLTFGLSAVAIAILIGIWCNYFYGWYFAQTTMLTLLPLGLIAYFLILLFSKKWAVQPLATDFKLQIAIACACLTMAILVLTAVATAASTRFGQVMTIVVCAGVFMLGLMSNHFLGRRAFQNRAIATIGSAAPVDDEQADFRTPGDTYTIQLAGEPRAAIVPGAGFYYGPSANGFPMATARFKPFTGDPSDARQLLGSDAAPGIIVTAADGLNVTIRHAGARALRVYAPPKPGDFVFSTWTRVGPGALAAWTVVPNMQFFWLLDAVTQNQLIPIRHMALVAGYGVLQIAGFLSLGVMLFQTRDVG